MTPLLRALLRPYRSTLLLALVLQAIAGLSSLLPWMLLAALAEPLARGAALDYLALAGVPLALCVWLAGQALVGYLTHRLDADLCHSLRLRLVAHLRQLPLDWFTRQGPEAVARLIEQDVRALHQLIAHAPTDLCNLLVVPLAALLWLGWVQGLWLPFALLPLLLAAWAHRRLRSPRYRREVERRDTALQGLGEDYAEFAGHLLLARQYPQAGVQGHVRAAAERFAAAFQAWVARVGGVAALVQVALGSPLLSAWALLGAALLALGGQMPGIGALCAFLLALRAIAVPVQALGHGGDALRAAEAAAQRLQAVFELAPLAEGQSAAVPADASVRVRGLSLISAERSLLQGIDLDLRSGSLNALVGPSGSGKSTLLQLLARYRDPDAGSIQLGGVVLGELPEAERHRQVLLVAQQAEALELSLHDNIALFRPQASHDEVRQAARRACLDTRIQALPEGYASVPGRDLVLSGGEAQRLALARALLSPAPLLLLDEPTAALDPLTAHALQRSLREDCAGRTRLVVAHQLAQVADAEQILLLDGGRIVERGTHNELLAAEGAYARLWQQQQAGEGRA